MSRPAQDSAARGLFSRLFSIGRRPPQAAAPTPTSQAASTTATSRFATVPNHYAIFSDRAPQSASPDFVDEIDEGAYYSAPPVRRRFDTRFFSPSSVPISPPVREAVHALKEAQIEILSINLRNLPQSPTEEDCQFFHELLCALYRQGIKLVVLATENEIEKKPEMCAFLKAAEGKTFVVGSRLAQNNGFENFIGVEKYKSRNIEAPESSTKDGVLLRKCVPQREVNFVSLDSPPQLHRIFLIDSGVKDTVNNINYSGGSYSDNLRASTKSLEVGGIYQINRETCDFITSSIRQGLW